MQSEPYACQALMLEKNQTLLPEVPDQHNPDCSKIVKMLKFFRIFQCLKQISRPDLIQLITFLPA